MRRVLNKILQILPCPIQHIGDLQPLAVTQLIL